MDDMDCMDGMEKQANDMKTKSTRKKTVPLPVVAGMLRLLAKKYAKRGERLDAACLEYAADAIDGEKLPMSEQAGWAGQGRGK